MVNVRKVIVLWTTLTFGGWLITYRLSVLNTRRGATRAMQLIKEILPNLASGCDDEKLEKEYDECVRTWASGFDGQVRHDGYSYRDTFCGSVY